MRNIKFPVNENEIKLIKFIGRYQYLDIKDVQYFFSGTYYPKRITKLIKNRFLRRYKKNLVLDTNGYNFLRVLKVPYNKLIYEKKYAERLKFMSHLSAIYEKNPYIVFTPSFEIKNKEVFTERSRKYIGILKIFGTNYLIYHIPKEKNNKYINSVIYDLQKECNHKNIIILVNDIKRLKLRDFAFGLNSVIITEDSDEKLNELKYLRQVNWQRIMNELYKDKMYLSEYNFCDYTDHIEKYVSNFFMIDSEKINKIDLFLRTNNNKKVEIVCNENIAKYLREELPTANFKIVNLNDYIEKEINIYD